MPSFLKDLSLRRRSKVSVKTADSADPVASSENSSSNDGEHTERPPPLNKSSSTLSSWVERSSPPTTLGSQKSKSSSYLPGLLGGNGNKAPPVPGNRPTLASSHSTRFSIVGMPLQNSESQPRQTPATSPYAPRVLSISDGSWVHQKVFLIYGQAADVDRPIDGTLSVHHHQDLFPSTQWPVCDSHFKALVYLQPGPNRLRLEFTSSKLSNGNGQPQSHCSWININFLPLNSSPPLQLCILVAKDSPGTFDAVPERKEKEGNNLETAIRKFRMAAYLWQAFTAEQMNRNGFGRRCYRYEEEWQPGTVTWQDLTARQMRNEIKIHVVTMSKTVSEIRDLDIAQQNQSAKNQGKLYDIAMNSVRKYFKPNDSQTLYVSCMFLDTHWDKAAGIIRGHAALGGGDGSIQLAIFGSHCLQSYPAHIEEVVPAFSDCTRTDTNFVANDCDDAGSNWEAANIGIGAHMHETGHLFGCPHQESGIMLRDYVNLNRTFTSREPYSTRTKQPGQKLCLPQDECSWHRLDTLRFRFHPCFTLPTDAARHPDPSVQVWSVDNGAVLVTAATGVAWIEIKADDDDVCHQWIEYLDPNSTSGAAPRQVTLTESQLLERLPPKKQKQCKRLRLKIFSCGGGEHSVPDFAKLASKDARLKLPDGRLAFRGSKLGASGMEGSQTQEAVLQSGSLLTNVRVYHGASLDGIEFFYGDGRSELFGKRGGRPGGSNFRLDAQMAAETLMGFYVRAGAWIDAIQLITSTGRRSEMYGNATGGSGHMLIPPRGYTLAGIHGSCGQWIDGFGLIITR